MIDFLMIATRMGKRNTIEIYLKFIIKKSKDLMIRGSDFYAIWLEERGLWSTEEQDALQLIDRELDIYVQEHKQLLNDSYRVLHMWDAESGMIDNWHRYCQRQMRDNYHTLDDTLIFANTPVKKDSYASKRLPYPLEKGASAPTTSSWARYILRKSAKKSNGPLVPSSMATRKRSRSSLYCTVRPEAANLRC